MPKIYFLCTGNACRSQMAEGLGKVILGPSWQVKSAGIEAHGLDPRAVQVMAEKGIDISQQYSKKIDAADLQTADLVVTLCQDAETRCPAVPKACQHLHWPLPDPAASGSMTVFRSVRDELEQRIIELAQTLD